jgi:hypothetical protein
MGRPSGNKPSNSTSLIVAQNGSIHSKCLGFFSGAMHAKSIPPILVKCVNTACEWGKFRLPCNSANVRLAE